MNAGNANNSYTQRLQHTHQNKLESLKQMSVNLGTHAPQDQGS